jgi:protein-disulfide isomerase
VAGGRNAPDGEGHDGRRAGSGAVARARAARRRRRRDLAIVAVLVVAAVGLVIGIVVGRGQSGAPAASSSALSTLAHRTPGDPMALGRPDAPVTMVMFSDYRCPFCAQFSRETEQQLVGQYVDTGRLRIEWRDEPLFGPESTLAAQAGRAAAAQGRFWQFTRAVYAAAPPTGHPELPADRLEQFAQQAGVADMGRFVADMNAPAAAAAVRNDLAQAGDLGITSTPAFVINGQPLLGAQPIAEFRAAIDGALGGR